MNWITQYLGKIGMLHNTKLRFVYLLLMFSLIEQNLHPQETSNDQAIDLDQEHKRVQEELEQINAELESSQQTLCKKYRNSYVSYYGKVYHINDCILFEINEDKINSLISKGAKIIAVDSKVIGSLKKAYEQKPKPLLSPQLLCNKYNNQYITYSHSDIYWVENCKKRKFPDYASFEHHRGKLKKNGKQVMSLELEMFDSIATGAEMASIINNEFKDILLNNTQLPDMIPNDEACQGLINRYVSYLGDIYQIEKLPGTEKSMMLCQKKKINGPEFTKSKKYRNYRLFELSSTQFISIPEAK